MGTIKPSKDKYLVVGDKKLDSKGKKKANKPLDEKGYKSKSHEESSKSKKKNSRKKKGKGEMNKCGYCGKGFHLDSYCMKKQIDMLTQILEKHNISLPEVTKKKEGGSSFEDKDRGHDLVTSTVRYPYFIFNFGASCGETPTINNENARYNIN